MTKLRRHDKPATRDKLLLNYASDEEKLISIFLASMYVLSIRFHNVFYLYSFCSLSLKRGVNRLTDQRILTVFSPGFRIQSKILTDLRILQLQRFAVFIDFWARSLDFA